MRRETNMKTIREERDFRNLDLFVDMVNNDPEHIARAKAKRERVLAAQRAAKAQKEPVAPETAILGASTGVALWLVALMAFV